MSQGRGRWFVLALRAHLRQLVEVWRGSHPVQLRLWGFVTLAFGLVVLRGL